MIYIRAELEGRDLYWWFEATTERESQYVPGSQRLPDHRAVRYARALREQGFVLSDKWGTMPEVPAGLGEP